MKNLISVWVDIVINDIASRGFLPSLQREDTISLVASQRDYAYATDVDHIFRAFVPDWGDPQGILKKRTWEEILQLMLEDGITDEGRPEFYTVRAQEDKIRLHLIPNAANAPASPTDAQKLHLFVYREASELAISADITEIKLKHTPIIIWGAQSMGARLDSRLDANDALVRYEAGIKRIIGDAQMDLDRPYQVRYNSE